MPSFLLFFWINFVRFLDHSKRRFTGLPTPKRSQITADLFLGGQYGLQALPLFKKLGVTGIVNMRSRSIYNVDETKDFHLLHLPTVDFHPPTLQQLEKGVEFINKEIENGGKVYIHCRLGEGRGATMTLAYLISTGLTLDDAFKLIKSIRIFIHPTTAQLDRLKEFEKKVQAQKS